MIISIYLFKYKRRYVMYILFVKDQMAHDWHVDGIYLHDGDDDE